MMRVLKAVSVVSCASVRRFSLVAIFASYLCACVGQAAVNGDSRAAAALRALPAPEYAATVALAQTIANRCAIYRYNISLGAVVDDQRAAQGTGVIGAQRQPIAVDLEIANLTAQLLQSYQVLELVGPNVCAVASGEVAAQTALGALLVRA